MLCAKIISTSVVSKFVQGVLKNLVRISKSSDQYFPAFGLNTEIHSVQMRKNTDQENSEYGHISRTDTFQLFKRQACFIN